jgi:hypothetical protein
MNIEERFLSFVEPEPNSGCWLWTGFVDAKGYGYFSLNGKTNRSHRVSYELYVKRIPKGLQIDHLCRVPCCVNPAHLEPVTPKENVRRGNAGVHNLLKTHCPKGHPYSGSNLYIHPNGGRGCRFCRKEASAKLQGREL